MVRRFSRGHVILGVIVLVGVAAGIWFLVVSHAGNKRTLRTEEVGIGSLTIITSCSGTVEPVSSQDLAFEQSGIIKTVAVTQGQEVKAGDLLLTQDDSDQRAQVASAEANVAGAQARLDQLVAGSLPEEIEQAQGKVASAKIAMDAAKAQADRQKALFEAQATSQKEADDAQNSYLTAQIAWQQADASLRLMLAGTRPEEIRQAEASLQSAQAQLTQARNKLASMSLSAPFSGIVGAVNATVGQRVSGTTVSSSASSSSQPLLSLVSSELRVRAQVNEADIAQIEINQVATFTVNAFPDRTFSARVSAVAPQSVTVSNVHLYEVLLALQGDCSGLKAGMPCNVDIVKVQHDNVLLVSKQAFSFFRTYASEHQLPLPAREASSPSDVTLGTVLIDNQGQVEPRTVPIGLSNEQYIEVISGIDPGERVVVGETQGRGAGSGSRNLGNTGNMGGNPGNSGYMGGAQTNRNGAGGPTIRVPL